MTKPGQRGFSLIELLVATVVITICALGVALMILYGTRLGAAARETMITTSLAKARLEELRVLPRGALERQLGGSLSADKPGHFDARGRYKTRWLIAAGPAGTQDITVAVLVLDDARAPAVRMRMLSR
jgi:prepilin-type N-terminal cleavage/methylation domain-containing protein